jgi:hypothetical protein
MPFKTVQLEHGQLLTERRVFKRRRSVSKAQQRERSEQDDENGASPRFLEQDFNGWPFKLADLETHYQWAEEQLGVNRDYGSGGLGQTVLRLLRRAGYPAEFLPFAVDTRPTRDGWLGGTVGNSVVPLLRSGALTAAGKPLQMATDAYATAILLNDQKTAALGVTAADQTSG